jgi:hypothetical protein
MVNKYYIDLDVLSRRFDISDDRKVQREKAISAAIQGLLEDGKIDCISSKPLKDETRLIRHDLKRAWLFSLYKKPGFSECVMTTQECLKLRDKLVKECAFAKEQMVDALHVTIAAMSKVDFFVTFNAKDFIYGSRKQCIEKFFKKELNHNIIVSTPQRNSTLRRIGQF